MRGLGSLGRHGVNCIAVRYDPEVRVLNWIQCARILLVIEPRNPWMITPDLQESVIACTYRKFPYPTAMWGKAQEGDLRRDSDVAMDVECSDIEYSCSISDWLPAT